MRKSNRKKYIVMLAVLLTLLIRVNVYAEIYTLLSCVINEQPINVSGKIGDIVSFTVDASNVKEYKWEYCSEGQNTWQSLGSGFQGYNSKTLTIELINNYRLTNGYRCKLVGTDGAVKYTDIVKVEKGEPAAITSQPMNAVGKIGDTVSFTVKASNVKTYKWEYRSEGQNTWQSLGSGFQGYNSKTLTIELINNYILSIERTGIIKAFRRRTGFSVRYSKCFIFLLLNLSLSIS